MTSPDLVVDALRIALIAFASYLAIVTAANVVVRLVGAHPVTAAIDRVTPALVRRAVAALLGASLSLPVAAGAQDSATDAPVVMHRLDEQAEVTTPALPPPPETTAAPAPPPAVSQSTWTIQPGEHFWAVAEVVLARAWGRPATDAEVVPYWRELVELNRAALADRTNADLVYPGQRFVLPPVPSRS